jgi:hypothetical protein
MPDQGMSHGFVSEEKDDNVFLTYRSFEMTIVRRKRAANPITVPIIIGGKSLMADKKALLEEDRQHLSEVYGESVTDMLDKTLERMGTELEGSLNFKVLAEDTDEEEKQEDLEEEEKQIEDESEDEEEEEESEDEEKDIAESEEEDKTEDEKETDPGEIDQDLLRSVAVALGISELGEVIQDMSNQLKVLTEQNAEIRTEFAQVKKAANEATKSMDDIVSEQFTAPNWRDLGYSPTKDNGNIVEKEEKEDLEKNKPGEPELNDDQKFMSSIVQSIKGAKN